ncbi:ferritin-like domain-containing protein [Nocardiopsis exhalans]|uniref:Ferritin-like domain-containing protein n=1 Tax=Nocardiopsis exhalans TaxID=163604 RepID=A0ABY5D803_9ACTN|nr:MULTISPECIES: ferritin-like fold-containing protein [Nocardiopsis]USY19198.1 ferritin-like domain-containing protein [Nocardiopsis exhalans]
MTQGPSADPGVIDLLGLLAYAELGSFFRLAGDAGLAPSLRTKGQLAGLAAAEQNHYQALRGRLVELGVDPEMAMAPFVGPLDSWNERTEPQSWLESLVKTYVGEGIAGDFYRKVAALADEDTRVLVEDVLAETERAEFVAEQVRAALEEDPKLAGRLSLWARRLVGEALSQAQAVAVDRPRLAALLARDEKVAEKAKKAGDSGLGDLAAVSRMFASLTEGHAARLTAMGLAE